MATRYKEQSSQPLAVFDGRVAALIDVFSFEPDQDGVTVEMHMSRLPPFDILDNHVIDHVHISVGEESYTFENCYRLSRSSEKRPDGKISISLLLESQEIIYEQI